MRIDGIAEARTHFAAAAVWAVEVVDGLSTSDWDGPGLGDWNLRALVGHTSRALLTVEEYLQRPAAAEVVRSPEEYFARSLALPAARGPAVHARGVAAGEALGSDPALAFAEIAGRVLGALRDVGNPVIETLVGGMRLDAYLPTRAFELVVHGLDMQRAAGASPARSSAVAPPADVLERALQLAASLSVQRGRGTETLLALTGREPLPDGFSVLGGDA